MTAQQIIMASMRKLAAYASGETPEPEELADGLSALQSMLRSWASMSIMVFATVKDSFGFTPGTSLYTWGTGGTFNSARPNSVIGAYIVDSGNVSHPVDLISEGRYRDISLKTTTGRPYAVFCSMTYPYVNVYTYPVPDAAETLKFDSWKPFTETSSFDVLSSTLAFPPMYEEAIIYNLALRLADEFGKTVTQSVAALASSSFDRLVNLNAANHVETISPLLPVGTSGTLYSINSDTYR